MAQVGVAAQARDVRAARERRVHEHDPRAHPRQQVADALGVVAGDGSVGEEAAEQTRAHGGELVQVQLPAGRSVEAQRGKGGKHARAGRGLEHDVAGADGGCGGGGPGHGQRRGELLEADLLLAPAGLRRLECGDGFEQREHALGAGRVAQQRAPVADQQEHDGGLGRFVGLLPLPGAGGVGAAEGGRHRVPEAVAVDLLAGLEGGEQAHRGGEEAAGGAQARRLEADRCARIEGSVLGAEQIGRYGGRGSGLHEGSIPVVV